MFPPATPPTSTAPPPPTSPNLMKTLKMVTGAKAVLTSVGIIASTLSLQASGQPLKAGDVIDLDVHGEGPAL
jgi:hypothetical protein